MRNVYAYLCQTRKIDSQIVSDLVKEGLLYQDKRDNAVFLHKDESGQIVGAELQGTNTYTRFKGVAAGTSDSLFAVKIGEPNCAYVFESAIDLLSFPEIVAMCNKTVDSTESAEISYTISDNWDDGFVAEVSVTNNSDVPFEAWRLAFSGNFEISNIWNVKKLYTEDGFLVENSVGTHRIG